MSIRSGWHSLGTLLCIVGVVVAAVVGGIGAMLAAAAITAQPAVFLATGVVVFLAVDALGAGLVARRARPGLRRSTGMWMFISSAGLLLAVFVATAAIPPARSHPAPRPVLPHQQDVGLPTGSRLTVVRLTGRAPATRTPVVVVHGGPGIPDLAANTTAFAPLTELGADVYLYAQLGNDTSTRLSDPRGYGLDRDVSDLEALRVRLGLDRMVLLGHSYGGAVAAAYLGEHPDHVERLILASPGSLDPADTSGDLATARLDLPQRLRLYREVFAPRPLLGWALLQINPAAAHAFLDDPEADARNDAVLTLAAPALSCRPTPTRPVTGSGFYAMQYPQSATAPAPVDLRARLTGLPTPTLIVKGGCDYLSWHSAIDYRDRLPNSQLLYLPAAGHNVYEEQPGAFHAAVAAFLSGQPVPGRTLSASRPSDYQGPP